MSTVSEVNTTWQNRAELSIAHGALTNSKRPECLVKGVYPTHLRSGRGAYVKDTNGKQYIDFVSGLGSNILGFGHEEVGRAVADAYLNGATLSLGTDLEVVTAEKVKELFPFVDRVRFLKTGSEACSAAVRIARAKTGRDRILSEGYHGWADGFVSLTPPALGVPEMQSVRRLSEWSDLSEAAAVIVEPVMTDAGPERRKWLQELRERCTASKTILIFDEIITGFRWPKMAVTNFWGIEPDLICLGKAMGNGMPISVVAGKKEVMECGDYFVSSTFAGEMCSLAAALKTMTLLQTKHDMGYLWEKGDQFQSAFNSLMPGRLWIEGYPTRGAFKGDEFTKARFWQEACRAGLLFGPSFFFNFTHIPLMDGVLNTCKDIAIRILTGAVKLEGELPKQPYAAKVRNA